MDPNEKYYLEQINRYTEKFYQKMPALGPTMSNSLAQAMVSKIRYGTTFGSVVENYLTRLNSS